MMAWKSSCSIASDDENSRHSFLSDCDSEFDLRPQPRYPAEKRSLTKQSSGRIEPPLTRSRAKASGLTIITPEPSPQKQRQSTLRRSVDAFTGMASTLTNSLNNNSILFGKQEPSTLSDRVPNSPLDGVNVLADKFESCSLDEGKFSRNCLWPSRETNSHYTRPITSPSSTATFGATPFSTFNSSPLFGQQQAQLWSRFRFAASTLRDNLWLEQLEPTPQHYTSDIFTPNPFNQASLSSQTVPPRLMTFQTKTPSSSIQEPSPLLFRQRKTTPTTDSASTTDIILERRSSSSKIFFTFTIFAVGLVLGYLLTNTLPPGLLWEICIKYFHLFYVYLQSVIKYFVGSL